MNKRYKSLPLLINNNKYLIIAFVFFLSYRFFFTWLLFNGRNVPPEPDDSYFYLSTATRLINPQSFEDFRLLPFSLWLNLISLATGQSMEKAYEINFYLGAIIMFFVLYYLLKKVEVSKIKRLFLIVIMSLYSGSGSYHGFYWVVPSFYQLGLFFILLTFILLGEKQNFKKIFLFSLLFIFIHPTSIFISTIFLIYAVLTYLINKNFFNKIKHNLIFLFIFLTISYFGYYLLGRPFSHSESPESFESISKLISNFLQGNINFQALPTIQKEYFSIFFFHPLSTIAFFLMFVFVYLEKKVQLLILYLSTLLLVTISTILPYGWRTLSLLWPITFLIIGYSLIGLYGFLKRHFRQLKNFMLIPIIALIILSTSFNLIGIKSMNTRNDYQWDRSCPEKIEAKNVFFYSNESMNAFILHGLNLENAHFLSMQNLKDYLSNNSAIVQVKPLGRKDENLSDYERLISYVTRKESFQPPQNAISWTQEPVSQSELEIMLKQKELTLKRTQDCGHFQIYNVINR